MRGQPGCDLGGFAEGREAEVISKEGAQGIRYLERLCAVRPAQAPSIFLDRYGLGTVRA